MVLQPCERASSCVPCPEEAAIPAADMEAAIAQAVYEAAAQGLCGKPVPLFLLARVAELTGGRSKTTNLALLRNNARVATAVAASSRC